KAVDYPTRVARVRVWFGLHLLHQYRAAAIGALQRDLQRVVARRIGGDLTRMPFAHDAARAWHTLHPLGIAGDKRLPKMVNKAAGAIAEPRRCLRAIALRAGAEVNHLGRGRVGKCEVESTEVV